MKKTIVAILFFCCFMGTVTASAAQVRESETVSPAVAALAQARQLDKARGKAKTATNHDESDKIGDRLKARVHALIPASAFANIDNPGTITPDTVKYHYAGSQHMATPVTA